MNGKHIMNYGHWNFPVEFNPDDWFGFIYRITNLTNQREYIGKKQFFGNRTKKVKGRTNRKHYQVDSGWETYTGSSVALNEDIAALGKENFYFEIISLHKTKGSLHYAEVELQIKENVLKETLDNGLRKYYNGHISAVKFIPPNEHSEETKMRISKTLQETFEASGHWIQKLTDEEKEEFAVKYLRGDNHNTKRTKTPKEYEQWKDENIRGKNNPMFGIEPQNKGKTFVELYGEEKAKKMIKVLSEKCGRAGENNGFYGKSHSEETKEKWRNDIRRKHVGENNGMYGKPCYYKMSDQEVSAWKEKISIATKGVLKSDEHKRKIGAAHKGKPKPTVICPYCNKVGAKGNMLRYHFENCKSKTSIS